MRMTRYTVVLMDSNKEMWKKSFTSLVKARECGARNTAGNQSRYNAEIMRNREHVSEWIGTVQFSPRDNWHYWLSDGIRRKMYNNGTLAPKSRIGSKK